MLLNDNIADIERPDGEYLHAFLLWMNFQDNFYIHQSLLLNIHDLHK